jgi:phospholipase A1
MKVKCFIVLFLFVARMPVGAESLPVADPKNVAEQTKFLASEDAKERLSITKYEPIYFAYGNPTTKLQLSFKYQLIESWPVYFGYTQLLLWNLNQESQPFKDVNYGPEMFYQFEIKKSVLRSLDVAPLAHLSNGRDGADSRSMNRGFLRANLQTPVSEGDVRLTTTVYTYYGNSKDNGDIFEYISPLDLKFTITQFMPWVFDKGELYFKIFPGGSYAQRWDRGGRELGLSFRLGRLGLKPSLYLEYYNGYAESLLDYYRYANQFRVGIIL